MVKYECFRCGYIASQRCNMKQHLNRKNICNPTEDNVEINEIKKYYGFEYVPPNIHQNPPKSTKIHQNIHQTLPPNLHQNPPKSTKNSENIHQNPPKSTKKIYICEYCNNIFSRSDSLNRHYTRCKKKKESETLVINQNEEIIKMKKESENMKKEIENLKNYTNRKTDKRIRTL